MTKERFTYKIQYTTSINGSPQYAKLTSTSREQARADFLAVNPTWFVITVKEC